MTAPIAAPRGRVPLAGWGSAITSRAHVVDLAAGDEAGLRAAVAEPGSRGLLARGLGRSYGDAALNGGGTVLRLGAPPGSRLEPATATVAVGGGTRLDDLLAELVPRGWFVPVVPGTRQVTIGGAIAADVHGKNHHVDGSIGDHVVDLRLLLADGRIVTVGPDRDAELFWATVGGMGLTGVIVDATLRIFEIETSTMVVDTRRAADLDDLLAGLDDLDGRRRYSVAWMDLRARGRRLGRGVLSGADHAGLDDLDARRDVLAYAPRPVAGVPPVPGRGVITRSTTALFDELWYRRAPRAGAEQLRSIPAFFHPLDALDGWNRAYGRRGLVQYQFVVPFGAERALARIVERFAAHRVPAFLTVLKRFGPANAGPLSFPLGGWTLAVDAPARTGGLGDLLHALDRMVVDAGGRHYLAKDAHATADVIRHGYPRLDEWRAVRDRVDPAGVWASDLARRLGLFAART